MKALACVLVVLATISGCSNDERQPSSYGRSQVDSGYRRHVDESIRELQKVDRQLIDNKVETQWFERETVWHVVYTNDNVSTRPIKETSNTEPKINDGFVQFNQKKINSNKVASITEQIITPREKIRDSYMAR